MNPEEEKDRFDVEKEWAEKLGMNFDSERAATPPPQPEPPRQEPPMPIQPAYQMPGGTQLPPMHPNGPMPPTYMIWAILSTICCCLPAGIVAIVYGSMVSSRYYGRDYEGARKASRMAEIWIIISIVAGIIFNTIYLPVSLLVAG